MKTLTTAEAYVVLLTTITNDFCRGLIDAEEYEKYINVYHRRAGDGTLRFHMYEENTSSSIYLVIGM